MSFFQKAQFMTSGLAGIFDTQEISEEQLAELRKRDVLSELMNELGKAMPVLKQVLIDERDDYLAEKIRLSKGKRVVAVVGAGHVQGICDALKRKKAVDMEKIQLIPPMSPALKIIGWGIPALILGSLAYIGIDKGPVAAGNNALFWFLANGIPCAIGAIIAGGHFVTIISSFLAAPFTSLTPLIGAGYVAAFVQAYYQPPLVIEFQSVTDDVVVAKRWWSNKLLRVILVFLLTGLGSFIGTWVGGVEIVRNLF